MYVNDNRLFDADLQTEVLRLITIGSPMGARYTARMLLSPCAAARQLCIDHAVPEALQDPDAQWSAAERELMVTAMGTPSADDDDPVRTPPAGRAASR